MNNYLLEDFFYDKDFNIIEDVAIAGDCVQQLLAIIMKKKVNKNYNQYAVYMGDISFNISVDNGGYITRSAIKSNETLNAKNILQKNRIIIRNDCEKAMKAITQALNTEGYAILRTVDAYLPFSIYSNEKYNLDNFQENGHFIMIVAEDNNNYYFIDQLTEVKLESFKHVNLRKDIGVCEKDIFKTPLSFYAKIITAEFNEENILNAGLTGSRIINESVDNFYNNISTRITEDTKIKIIGGKVALEYLLNACKEGKFILNKKVYNSTIKGYCDFDIGHELMNGATGLKNRRLVLKGFLQNKVLLDTEELITSVNNSIEVWDRFKNHIIKKILKKEYFFGGKDIDYIEKIVDAEKEMFKCMSFYKDLK